MDLYKILIVDDDPIQRVQLRDMLNMSKMKFELVEAANGQDALDKLSTTDFDVIITDKRMPVMNGDEFCRHVRTVLNRPLLPIIMITADYSEDTLAQSFSAGVTDFVRKPFIPVDIEARIRSSVRNKRLTDQLDSKANIERISKFYKMLSELKSANLHATDREILFTQACQIAVDSGLFHHASIGMLDQTTGNVTPTAQASRDGSNRILDTFNIKDTNQSAAATAVKTAKHVFFHPQDDGSFANEAVQNASMIFPLTQRGQIKALFKLDFYEVNFISDEIIQLLDSLAADISFTLDFMAESEEREQMQHEIEALSLYKEKAREDERKHLARELHDELGQAITALRFDLNWLGSQTSLDETSAAKISAMKKLVNETVETIHNISENLRPGMLDDLGLIASIENCVLSFTQRTTIPCQLFTSPSFSKLDELTETTLYRITQEALTNVARHSGATQVTIYLHEMQDKVLLIVQDNGRGLPVVRDRKKITYGLLGMRERIKILRGNLEISTEPSSGVRLEISVPKTKKAQHD